MVPLNGDFPVALIRDEGEGAVAIGLALQPDLTLIQKPFGAAEFRLKELGADIVMIEHIADTVLFKT